MPHPWEGLSRINSCLAFLLPLPQQDHAVVQAEGTCPLRGVGGVQLSGSFRCFLSLKLFCLVLGVVSPLGLSFSRLLPLRSLSFDFMFLPPRPTILFHKFRTFPMNYCNRNKGIFFSFPGHVSLATSCFSEGTHWRGRGSLRRIPHFRQMVYKRLATWKASLL